MKKENDNIYNKFVSDSNDIEGIMAYASFCKEKNKYINELIEKQDENLSESIKIHDALSTNFGYIKHYRYDASKKLKDYYNRLLDVKLSESYKYYETNCLTYILRTHKQNMEAKHFLNIVLACFFGISFISLIIVLLYLFIF